MTTNGEINQAPADTIISFVGNTLNKTLISTGNGSGNFTFGVYDTVGGSTQGLIVLPNSSSDLYNPIVNSTDVSLISSATGANVGFTLSSGSSTTNGIRMLDTNLVIGAGGSSDTPAVNLTFNNPANSLEMSYTNLALNTIALNDASPGVANLFLPITINGVAYKISLFLG
jgi:hypothetical protein